MSKKGRQTSRLQNALMVPYHVAYRIETAASNRGLLLLLFGSAVLLSCLLMKSVQATEVTAGSSFFATKNGSDVGSDTWRFSTPVGGLVEPISWESGFAGSLNVTDSKTWPISTFGPEAKFTGPTATTPLAGRTFTGFTDNDGPAAPGTSTTTTSGSGSSASIPGLIWGTNWTANWKVTATGTKGLPYQNGSGQTRLPSWKSSARALDPFTIYPSQLSNLTEPNYDLFFGASLEGGSLSEVGNIGLEVFYDTASESINLLDISIDGQGAVITNDNSADLSLYLLSSLEEGPTENVANRTTLTAIEDLLTTDIVSDGSIESPLYLGFVFDDLPVPTVDMGGGSVGRIRIESSVTAGELESLSDLSGDFNEDGVVDATDLLIWQENHGIAYEAFKFEGDADGDGNVDGGDFLVWQQQFGVSLEGALIATSPVPEPTSVMLLLFGATVVCMRRYPSLLSA